MAGREQAEADLAAAQTALEAQKRELEACREENRALLSSYDAWIEPSSSTTKRNPALLEYAADWRSDFHSLPDYID